MAQKRTRKKAYTAREVMGILSTALNESRNILLYSSDENQKLRAVTAIATAANSFRGLQETHDFEERLKKLEEHTDGQ